MMPPPVTKTLHLEQKILYIKNNLLYYIIIHNFIQDKIKMQLEERVKFIEHKGEKILFIDMSNLLEKEMLEIIDYAKKIIRNQQENSLLTLTDVTHSRYNVEVVNAMQEYTKGNKPYVKKAAILGVNPIKRIIFNKIMEFSKRDLVAFDTIEKAKDWLVEK